MKKIFNPFLLLVLVLLLNGAISLKAQQEPDKNFDTFLKEFTTDPDFQYSRIKFPLKTPIILLNEDGTEIEIPFSADEWPLLTENDFAEGKYETEDGLFYGEYKTREKDKVVFESGIEESEIDLIITFELSDGRWYVTDCYNGWYGSLPAEEYEAVLYEVQQRNAELQESVR